MSSGFIMLRRTPETLELLRDGDAFLLLTQIALRARRTEGGINPHHLAPGCAMIGDYATCGLSERRARTAKNKLARWGLATFRATNRGTIATLSNTAIYDANIESSDEQPDRQETSQRRAGDERSDGQETSGATTNKRENNVNNKEEDNKEEQLELAPSGSPSVGIDIARLRREAAERAQHLWDTLRQSFPDRSDRTTRTFRMCIDHMTQHALLGKPEALQWLTDALQWISVARSNGTRNPAGRWVSLVQQHTGLPKASSRGDRAASIGSILPRI